MSANINLDSRKATYSFAVRAATPAATCTDLLVITGLALSIVKLRRLSISGKITSAADLQIDLLRRTTAAAGGTATQPVIAKHFSGDTASGVVVDLYSANPTVGTAGQLLKSKTIALAAPGVPRQVIDLANSGLLEEPITLNGLERIAINLAGAVIAAGTVLDIEGIFTQE